MKKKLLILNISVITISVLIIFISSIFLNRKIITDQASKELINITNIYAENYNKEQMINLKDDIRITIIDSNYIVIDDNENKSIIGIKHDNRKELDYADENIEKVVIRTSDSLNTDMIYYAKKIKYDDSYIYIRTSIKLSSIKEYNKLFIPIILVILIVNIILSFIVSIFITKKIMNPIKKIKISLEGIKEGNFEKIEKTDDEEINIILDDINKIEEKLHSSIRIESEERKKLNFIIENISDGIIVLNENKKVNIINNVAKKIYKDNKYKEILNAHLNDKKDKTFDYKYENTDYLVTIKYLDQGLIIIVITDVSAIKNNERLRSEFFANASHELKTPLTVIKGFNDIISMESKEENIKLFSSKIDKEVSRIITLINDMLNLSKLETQQEKDEEYVELSSIAQEVKESLYPLSFDKNIKVEINGQAKLKIEKEHAFELIKNLVENGIRYNKQNGYVKVNIKDNQDNVSILIKDNGIGIEKKNQQRIFERFYRVNKSRSRETGGTGLGLSIVKHICNLYNAKINIESELEKGTSITITFNK